MKYDKEGIMDLEDLPNHTKELYPFFIFIFIMFIFIIFVGVLNG